MGGEGSESRSLEYTPTWILAVVCSVMVLICLLVERSLHHLGKWLKRRDKYALYQALQKLQEELMLLGFVSLLLTVSQERITKICIPTHLANQMLPCKMNETTRHLDMDRRFLSEDRSTQICGSKGKVPLVSLEGLHQLHIFIFVLAVVHVIFCATTMVLGVAKMNEWKRWEYTLRYPEELAKTNHHYLFHLESFIQRTIGHFRKLPVLRWTVSFFKQFYGSVTMSDYVALRAGFIREHCPDNPDFNFHKYMLHTLEYDFKRIVGISWYLWLFVAIFLLLNICGWYTYFWLSFLPLILLVVVGAHLEHIITRLARDVVQKKADAVKPSDDHFWCSKPKMIIYLIHFVLFQNSFEIAFFFWVWTMYGFNSCVMEKVGYIITKLVLGAIVQVVCSYSTLPLFAIVSQMGSMLKRGVIKQFSLDVISHWIEKRRRSNLTSGDRTDSEISQIQQENIQNKITEHGIETSMLDTSNPNRIHFQEQV